MAYIVIIGPAYPFRGGIAAFNESLARTWQAMGHQVEIITFTTQYPSVLFPGKTQFVDNPPPADLNIQRKLSSVNPVTWVTLGTELHKKKPDVALLRYWLPFMAPCLGTVARLTKRNGHTRIIALVDNIVPHEKRMGDPQLTQYFVNSCDAFVTMSDTVTTDLQHFTLKKPIISSPHPIYDTYGDQLSKDEARQKLDIPLEGNYLLFFGFIRHYKGLDILLQAMQDVRLKELGVSLIIAGEYYEPAEPYEILMNDPAVEGRVFPMTTYIPHDQVATYFSAADLIVQPYRNATQSGVTQIAYHFNKPMVVTNVGGLQEMVPDQKAGYVVEVTPLAIAEAVHDFYKNNKEPEMVPLIQEEKKRFSWEIFAAKVLEA